MQRKPEAQPELVLFLEPGLDTWRVTYQEPGGAPHSAPSPLRDTRFLTWLSDFQRRVHEPVASRAPGSEEKRAWLQGLALKLGEALTTVLLSPETQHTLVVQSAANPHSRARLTLRVAGGAQGDRILALPWELLLPAAGRFPVKDGSLELVREAVMEEETSPFPALEPVERLTLALVVAAPDGTVEMSVEDEEFRLQTVLTAQGHRLAVAGLGELEEFIQTAQEAGAHALHFCGHGAPGALFFETHHGLSHPVPAGELARRLHALREGAQPWRPRLFFLSACHGAAVLPVRRPLADSSPSDEELSQQSTVTAATLHRAGIPTVIGFLGPLTDGFANRFAQFFYEAVANGRSPIQALADARPWLSEPLDSWELPFAWSQVAVYHRGPDGTLVQRAEASVPPEERFVRQQKLQPVSGLPFLEHGFIGRRTLQHEARFKLEREHQRLLVIHGLGGLGKTSLALWLLRRVLKLADDDILVLPCDKLHPDVPDATAALWDYVDRHARETLVDGWASYSGALARELAEKRLDAAGCFSQGLRFILTKRPHLVLYVDNAETLLEEPADDPGEGFARWRSGARQWWKVIEGHAQEGRVLITSRFIWRELPPDAQLGITPMSHAEVHRMVGSFPTLGGRLPTSVQAWLAGRIAGHPFTVKLLDDVVRVMLEELNGEATSLTDWKELLEPLLERGGKQAQEHLLLDQIWSRLGDAAREQMKRLTLLQAPAPRQVLDALGSVATTERLIAFGLLTRVLQRGPGEEGWQNRWKLHEIVSRFVSPHAKGLDERAAHRMAGEAYAAWVEQPEALNDDRVQAIFHLHRAGEGDSAWRWVRERVVHLRDMARYEEARALLEENAVSGTTGDSLARCLALSALMQVHLGRVEDMLDERLEVALRLAETDETRAVVLHAHGIAHEHRGRYTEAEAVLGQAIALKARSAGMDSLGYGAFLHALANLLDSQGRYSEAETLLRQIAELRTRVQATQHPEHGAILHTLANVLDRQGKYAEAVSVLREALTLKARVLGEDHPSYGASLYALANVLEHQGRSSEAESLLSQVRDIHLRYFTKEHPDYGATLYALANTLESQGRYSEAESLHREAIELRSRALGADHPDFGNSLQALANLLLRQGRSTDAERLLRQAMDLQARTLGTHHPAYSASLHALATVLESQGRDAEAEALLRQVLEAQARALGKHHPAYGASLHALATVLESQGRYTEAELLLLEALQIDAHALGKHHPSYAASLQALANVLDRQGLYAEAEPLLREALEIQAFALGRNHSDYGATLQTLANVLDSQARYSEAEDLLHEALEIQAHALGESHPDYSSSLHALALVLYHQGRDAEAETLFRQTLDLETRTLGADHPDLAPTLATLGSVIARQDRPEEARGFVARAVEITRASQGSHHPDTAQALAILAPIQATLREAEARETAREALEILRETLGPEHPTTQALGPRLLAILDA